MAMESVRKRQENYEFERKKKYRKLKEAGFYSRRAHELSYRSWRKVSEIVKLREKFEKDLQEIINRQSKEPE